MTTERDFKDATPTIRRFMRTDRNHGYGFAIGATQGCHVVVGIRREHEQGEVAGIESLAELERLIALLREAGNVAFSIRPKDA